MPKWIELRSIVSNFNQLPMNPVQRLFQKQWFLIVLVICLVSGFMSAEHFQWLRDLKWLTWCIAAFTMFFMAWPLQFGLLRRTFSRPTGPILATVVNLVAIPILAWPIASSLGPLLGPGLIVAAATPTTLATGAVWTRRAGGDDSVAIMVTLITNSICFFVTPLWVYFLTGNEIPALQLTGTIFNLLMFVVIPILAGQLIRLNQKSATWATANKPMLGVFALIGILCIVFIGAVNTGSFASESNEPLFTWTQLAATIVAVIGIHVSMFFFSIKLASLFKLPRPEQIAVGFAGSQKTLMIGLSTSISLGFSIIPIVAYHAFQLVIGAVIADRIRSSSAQQKRLSEPSESVADT